MLKKFIITLGTKDKTYGEYTTGCNWEHFCYKAADLTSQLTKLGHQVKILMTPAATAFITPLTLQVLSKQAVLVEVMTEDDPKQIQHIDLGKEADLF